MVQIISNYPTFLPEAWQAHRQHLMPYFALLLLAGISITVYAPKREHMLQWFSTVSHIRSAALVSKKVFIYRNLTYSVWLRDNILLSPSGRCWHLYLSVDRLTNSLHLFTNQLFMLQAMTLATAYFENHEVIALSIV